MNGRHDDFRNGKRFAIVNPKTVSLLNGKMGDESPQGIFLNWVDQSSRSETLARAFDTNVFFVPYLQRKGIGFALMRYVCASIHTTALLLRKRPKIVFVMNQPVFLPFLVYLLSFLLNYRFVVDSHAGLFNKKKWIWAQPLMKWVCRRSLFTIVTNPTHKEIVEGWGANVEILKFLYVPDGASDRQTSTRPDSIVVIGTFAEDEPTLEILQAAARCPTVRFYMTGDCRKANQVVKERRPQNVQFTDFLERKDYISLVKSVDAAMILVTSDNTMQRGAYEAVSWGTPIITSDWPLLRETFPKGALFVKNDVDSIALGVTECLSRREQLKAEIQEMRSKKESEWNTRIRQIKDKLNNAARVVK